MTALWVFPLQLVDKNKGYSFLLLCLSDTLSHLLMDASRQPNLKRSSVDHNVHIKNYNLISSPLIQKEHLIPFLSKTHLLISLEVKEQEGVYSRLLGFFNNPWETKEKFHIPESITYRLLDAQVGQTEHVSLLYFTLDVLKAMSDFFQTV